MDHYNVNTLYSEASSLLEPSGWINWTFIYLPYYLYYQLSLTYIILGMSIVFRLGEKDLIRNNFVRLNAYARATDMGIFDITSIEVSGWNSSNVKAENISKVPSCMGYMRVQ